MIRKWLRQLLPSRPIPAHVKAGQEAAKEATKAMSEAHEATQGYWNAADERMAEQYQNANERRQGIKK